MSTPNHKYQQKTIPHKQRHVCFYCKKAEIRVSEVKLIHIYLRIISMFKPALWLLNEMQ